MLNKKEIVVSTLKQDIYSGKYACGEKIPSRNQLMRRFHCSRTVIERAIDELTSGGLLCGRQGWGTFVCREPEKKRQIRRLNVVSPYDAKSFRSPFTCLLLNSATLNIPLEVIPLDRAESEAELLCQHDSLTVFINPRYEQLSLMNHLKIRNIPLIVINREFDGFDRIYTDTLTGFRQAVSSMEKISDAPWAVISREVQLEYPYLSQRQLAFFRSATESGIAISPENILITGFQDIETDIRSAAKLFRQLPVKIAVLTVDLAIPLFNLANSMGLQCGKEYHLLIFEYHQQLAGIPGVVMIRQKYDEFYNELLRYLNIVTLPGKTPFIRAVPPEIIIQ